MSFGARAVGEACREVERLARAGEELAGLSGRVTRIEAAFGEAATLLRHEFVTPVSETA